jgi:hypothetical protein
MLNRIILIGRVVCGAKLDEVEAVPAEKEEKNAKNSAKKKL